MFEFHLPPPAPFYAPHAPLAPFSVHSHEVYLTASAVSAVPAVPRRTPGEEMREVLPELFDERSSCPAGKCPVHEPIDLYRLIQHLNDEHKWTRESIADWLDTLDVDLTFKPAQTGD